MKHMTTNLDNIEVMRQAALESGERMARWFAFAQLPKDLQPISAAFCSLACTVIEKIQPGPERTVALRKLLEGKDAAVRSIIEGFAARKPHG